MKEGLGEIQIEFTADLPRGGPNRRLIFENHHQSRIAAYMVNCLVPRDKNIRIAAQNRNENQSFYQLDYVQAGGRTDLRLLLGTIALILSAGLVVLSRQRALFVLLAASLAPTVAHAHSMYQSDVKLDFAGDDVHAELQLPLDRIGSAFGKPIHSQTLDLDRTSLTAYVLDSFVVRTPDGRTFRTRLESPLTIAVVDGAPYLVARVVLQPPAGTQAVVFEIEDDLILGQMPSQVALVSIRSDWSTSVFANDPQLIGVLRSNSRSLTIDRTGRSWFRGFAGIFRLGMRHIAEGTDHLLFLLALLLPAPLLLLGSRWAGFAGVRHSLLQIFRVVTAFTAGHSITLALAALGLVRVPSRPIEVLIAVSILVSAAHALRPLFPGREAGIAAFFGLIHGLAFATIISELGLGRWQRVASILGFNLGIEAMQMIVVAVTMPSLVLLSRTRAYSVVRIGGALFAGVASVCWIIERLLDTHSWVDLVVDSIAHRAVWIAVVLFLISLVWRFAGSGPVFTDGASQDSSFGHPMYDR